MPFISVISNGYSYSEASKERILIDLLYVLLEGASVQKGNMLIVSLLPNKIITFI